MSFGFPYLKNELSDLHCIHVYDSEGLEYIEVQNSFGTRKMSNGNVLAL